MKKILSVFFLLTFLCLGFSPSHVLADVPTGFTKLKLLGGLKDPTTFRFAKNGDIYIGLQCGAIYIYRNNVLLPTPVVQLPAECVGEQGLLGIELDPNFATNGYLYVSYTNKNTLARLSRITVSNDVANPASEVILSQGNQFAQQHHNANDLRLGPDGKIWWSVGDNVPATSNAQNLNNIYGKILRFNLDGSVPSDNPFLNIPGAVGGIYAYGLRNPFRFDFLPNGSPVVADTGSSYWEELNVIQKGGNYGWPFVEGVCGSCGAINPAFAYGHLPVDGAISAVAAYNNAAGVFPQNYNHVVFFGDYNRQDIEAVNFDSNYQTQLSDTVFDSTAGTIADLREGPDGNLYYLDIFGQAFYKISPNGLAPLSTTNATQTATSSTSIAAGKTPPTVTMVSPTLNATYNAGDTINFAATGTDAVDGSLPASAFSWKVDLYRGSALQPFYYAENQVPFAGPFSQVSTGNFQIPTDLSNDPTTFYRVTLTASNSAGLTTVVTRDVHPNTTSYSVSANPSGASFVADGTWQTSTLSATDVVNVQHVLGGVPTQKIGNSTYRFHDWSDGGALQHSVTNLAGHQNSYSAKYDAVQAVPPPWQSLDIGSPLVPGGAAFSANDSTFYVDGAGADIYGTHDQFHYVYQPLNGDGSIIARVRYVTNASDWVKSGLMIKESTASMSSYVNLFTTQSVASSSPNVNGLGCTPNGCLAPLPPVNPAIGHGVHMQYGYKYDQAISDLARLAGFGFPNEWLKLQRVGNVFTSFLSKDGVTWTQVGTSTVQMNSTATIGLFVSSHNIGELSSVAFDNVQVTGVQVQPVQLSNLQVADLANGSAWSIQNNLQPGQLQYGDRNYTFSILPAYLVGSTWIRTANSSRGYVTTPLATFSINQAATVYISIDTRLTPPSWIDNTWVNSGLTLTDNQTLGHNGFVIYAKVFPAGTVSLGPNSSTGNTTTNMYTVLVK